MPRRHNSDLTATMALAGAGVLVGHEIGYLAGAGDSAGHDYFALLAPLAIIGVAAAMWLTAVSILRKAPQVPPSTAVLIVAQVSLYSLFEVGERVIGAADSPLLSLPVLLGLIAQPFVAWGAVRLLELGASVLEVLTDRAATTPLPKPQQWVRSPLDPTGFVAQRRAAARAPPLVF